MKPTVDDIRRVYPAPIVDRVDVPDDSYCVGGALCLYLSMHNSIEKAAFPLPCEIARVLCRVNPALDFATAEVYAGHITDENDLGNFEDAWAWLDKALSYSAEVV